MHSPIVGRAILPAAAFQAAFRGAPARVCRGQYTANRLPICAMMRWFWKPRLTGKRMQS